MIVKTSTRPSGTLTIQSSVFFNLERTILNVSLMSYSRDADTRSNSSRTFACLLCHCARNLSVGKSSLQTELKSCSDIRGTSSCPCSTFELIGLIARLVNVSIDSEISICTRIKSRIWE
uniref:Uncharacterized protein n=1 Tax=Arundo donax TaxID=35708 RepID=A0A0A9CV32_ARUDO